MNLGGKKSASNTQGRQPRRQAVAPKRQEFFSYHASSGRGSAPADQQARRSTAVRQNGDAASAAPRRSGITRERLPIILAVLIVVCSLLYTTTLSSTPKITIEGGDDFKALRSVEAYQRTAEDIMSASILNKSKLTIDTGHIKEELQQRFPELSDVQITLPLTGHRPVIHAISERPALLLATQRGVFVVGENGKLLMKSTDANVLPDLPSVRDDANLAVEPGKSVLSAQDVDFITSLYTHLASKQIAVSSLTLPVLASELHVRLSDRPYYVKFSLLTDPRIAAGQYIALMNKLDRDNIVPSEYVDSRVEERIFYK